MSVIVEIRKQDSEEELENKIKEASNRMAKLKEARDGLIEDKKKRLSQFFGALKLNEDPVILQRRWRDEW
ncbi:hypothetical protein [Mucilaginibacter sp. HD30]